MRGRGNGWRNDGGLKPKEAVRGEGWREGWWGGGGGGRDGVILSSPAPPPLLRTTSGRASVWSLGVGTPLSLPLKPPKDSNGLGTMTSPKQCSRWLEEW